MNPIILASYFCYKYKNHLKEPKLHKYLYFFFREYIIQFNEKLFNEEFHICKFGVYLPIIHNNYDILKNINIQEINDEEINKVLNIIFNKYKNKNSFSLSRIIYGEFLYKNAKLNKINILKFEDIYTDAMIIKERRKKLNIML